MALLFMDGFDAGDYAQKGWYLISGAMSASATTRFGTGNAMYTTNVAGLAVKAITPSAHVFVGFACSYTGGGFFGNDYFCVVYTDNSSVQHLKLQFVNSTTLGLYRGTTLLQSYGMPLTNDIWNYFEMEATIDDVAGICKVRLNGTEIFNFSGDTRNGGTSTLIDGVGIGGFRRATDDLYVCNDTGAAPYNTFLGEIRVYSLSPTGAGSSTQFTPSSGANYTTVDELPYSASDYVSSSTSGQRDTYTMTDLPAVTGNILAVQHNAVAKRTDASSIALKPAIKSGATVYYGTATNLTAYDTTVSDLRTTDPATSAAWTNSGVNALEGGFEVA